MGRPLWGGSVSLRRICPARRAANGGLGANLVIATVPTVRWGCKRSYAGSWRWERRARCNLALSGSAEAMTCSERLQVCHGYCVKSMGDTPAAATPSAANWLRSAWRAAAGKAKSSPSNVVSRGSRAIGDRAALARVSLRPLIDFRKRRSKGRLRCGLFREP